MRAPADAGRIRTFLHRLGESATVEGRVYLTGGATAVLRGWRETTIDLDLRLEPESDELLRRLVELKEALDINVELASPLDFIPEPPGWRERCPSVMSAGRLDVLDFDPYSQALSKIERAFEQDIEDVESMLREGLVKPPELLRLFEAIEPMLFRFPALDPASFRSRVEQVVAGHGS